MRVSSEHTGLLNLCMVVFGILVLGGCARLPYTKTVVHEDQRVAVRLQAEVSPAGYSHPVEIEMPAGIKVETPTPTEVIIKGADRQRVGQIASEVRAVRPPEPYKGKGIRYADEKVVIKETKKK